MPVIISYETRSARHIDAFLESARRATAKVVMLSSPPPQTAAYASFRKNYFHRSVNPPEFELACFDRYFVIYEFLKTSSIDAFILSDTDVLVQRKYQEIGSFIGSADVVLSAPTTRSHSPTTFLEMSPHFSFWTRVSLESFLEFLVKTYQTADGRAELQAVADANERISARAGISDMTLLAMWASRSSLNFLNGTAVRMGATIDHNVGMSSHATPDQFQMRLGAKRLVFSPEGFYLRTMEGDPVYPYAIHFQGRYKLIMRDTLDNKVAVPLITSTAIGFLRNARAKWLSSQRKN